MPDTDATAARLELLSGLQRRGWISLLNVDEWLSWLSILRPRHRRVIILRFIHGLRQDQIAERICGQTGSTLTRSRIQQIIEQSLIRLRYRNNVPLKLRELFDVDWLLSRYDLESST